MRSDEHDLVASIAVEIDDGGPADPAEESIVDRPARHGMTPQRAAVLTAKGRPFEPLFVARAVGDARQQQIDDAVAIQVGRQPRQFAELPHVEVRRHVLSERRPDRLSPLQSPIASTQHERSCIWGTAMDRSECVDAAPETISIQRCRDLLGDEADALSDDDVRAVVRHADAMARILLVLAAPDGGIH